MFKAGVWKSLSCTFNIFFSEWVKLWLNRSPWKTYSVINILKLSTIQRRWRLDQFRQDEDPQGKVHSYCMMKIFTCFRLRLKVVIRPSIMGDNVTYMTIINITLLQSNYGWTGINGWHICPSFTRRHQFPIMRRKNRHI